MKKIIVSIPSLLGKLQEMSNDKMEYVEIAINDEEVDQDSYAPAFLHFDAFNKNFLIKDYESVDSILEQIFINESSCISNYT